MTDALDREIDQLFGNGLLPLAARLKREGTEFLEVQLQGDVQSYFARRARAAMSRADFETGGCLSLGTVEADLVRLWSGPDDRLLAALAPGMAKLARSLRLAQEETADVSHFVYVMY